MTCVAAATGFVAYLFPQQRALFGVLAAAFFIVAIYCIWRAVVKKGISRAAALLLLCQTVPRS